MRSRIRRNLSFANVMSVIAVFIAIGGGAYAAATISGADIINNSVRGKDIKEGTLKPFCPPKAKGLALQHVCYGAQRVANDWDVAARDCAANRLRLPSIGEALLITNKVSSGYIWTDEVSSGANHRAFVKSDETGLGRIATGPKEGPVAYRCVATAR